VSRTFSPQMAVIRSLGRSSRGRARTRSHGLAGEWWSHLGRIHCGWSKDRSGAAPTGYHWCWSRRSRVRIPSLTLTNLALGREIRITRSPTTFGRGEHLSLRNASSRSLAGGREAGSGAAGWPRIADEPRSSVGRRSMRRAALTPSARWRRSGCGWLTGSSGRCAASSRYRPLACEAIAPMQRKMPICR
jgi:hypothetical protein